MRMLPTALAFAIALAGPALAEEVKLPPPAAYKEIADIPLDQCNPGQVLNWVFIESMRRDGQGIAQNQKDLQAMLDITSKLPQGDVPVGQTMNHQQAAEFAQIEARNSIHFLQHLAETRLQRDGRLIGFAVETIDKLRRGETDIKAEYDTEGDGAALVGLLRKTMANDDPDIEAPARPTACSFDLAIYTLSHASLERMTQLSNTAEFKQFQELRAKYKITQGPLDPDALPSPDKEKAVWLAKAVGDPMRREYDAVTDLGHLRSYARASRAEYDALLQDVAIGLGDKTYSYETHAKALYAAGDAATKHAVDSWVAIENAVPSDATKETKQLTDHMAEFYKEQAEKKPAQAATH